MTGKTVLFLINDLRWFFSHRLPLGRAIAQEGGHVVVASPPSPLAQKVAREGFDFFSVNVPRNLGAVRAELGSILELARLYRRVRPDLVHHVTMKPVLYGSVAARMARVPAVVNAVAGLGYVFMSRGPRATALRVVVRPLYRVALSIRRSRTIFQNEDDLELFVRLGLIAPARTVLIRGSGVDTTAFRPTPEPEGRPPTLMLVSRMLWDKGVGEFIEAARILKRDGTPCRCVLVGDPDPGNPTSIPEETLRQWAAEGVVEWWGHSTDVSATMSQANVVVLPSYREGLPKVLLEAAAAGRAVVTTDVPGCRDAVVHGGNGFVVPGRDAPALAEALQHLVQQPALRRRMGAAGRRLVEERFALEIVTQQTLEVYGLLLRERM